MLKPHSLRQALRATRQLHSSTTPAATRRATLPSTRTLSTTSFLRKDDRDQPSSPSHDSASTSAPPQASGNHEGQFARTSDAIQVDYPEEDHTLPPTRPVSGIRKKPTLSTFSLEGRVGVVTGGARGLGLVMAQALTTSGADVALVDLNIAEAERSARELVSAFKAAHPDAERLPRVTAHYADVSSPESVDAAVQDVLALHGKIDNLVTSAGFTENYEAVAYPHDRMKKLWGVNVDGTYLFAVAVARHLMERNSPGSMVFIGSMSGSIVNVPQPQAPYNAAKAAVRHLAASLAVEWAEKGIRVNCISPGYMEDKQDEKDLGR